MPVQKFFDVPGGDTLVLEIVDEKNGYKQAIFDFPETDRIEYFRSIVDIKFRTDDVFLNSYPKSGTNWLWEMLHLVVNRTTTVSGDDKAWEMLENLPTGAVDRIPSPRILNTHLKTKYIPRDAKVKNSKTILLCRNPKDVVVSLYNHTRGIKVYEYEGKFDNFLEMFMRGDGEYGSFIEYLKEWQHYITRNPNLPILIVYYEHLKKNCLEEMEKVLEFPEIDIKSELLEEIVDNCHISKIKDSKLGAMDGKTRKDYLDIFQHGFSIYRKGEVGDWKNWFTVSQNERFEAWWGDNTKELTLFNFVYE